MKALVLFVLGCVIFPGLHAQTAEAFHVELEEITIEGSPGVHSFVHAAHDGKWLILGGRTDGLHQRQPFASFLAADNNVYAYVVDPTANQSYSVSLASLPTGIYEQLQSTNMEFGQRDSMLYIMGGYGYSATLGEHVTHPALTAVHVPGLVNAIVNGDPVTPYFRQVTSTQLQVTGGYLGRMGDVFYLAGGQLFNGLYNPIGPGHGPGFVQQYTNAIKRFRIDDDGVNLGISDYEEWVDTANLHRRDYNMSAQVFPDGTYGFTMFSGVFQHTQDLPWLNTVDIRDTGYTVRNDFNQYLNQYHTAHMPVYDQDNNAMHTVFFGGMSRYVPDANGQLTDDPNVPFVRTISMVTRYPDNSMNEFKIGVMPGLLGSGAEFIPVEGWEFIEGSGIVSLSGLPYAKTLVGYVVGGIESTAENIFFINTGTQSDATTRIFKVYITRGVPASVELIGGEQFFTTNLYPNPSREVTVLDVSCPHETQVTVELMDAEGRLLKSLYKGGLTRERLEINTASLAPGQYFIRISNAQYRKVLKLGVL